MQLFREITLHSKMLHNNIVQFYAAFMVRTARRCGGLCVEPLSLMPGRDLLLTQKVLRGNVFGQQAMGSIESVAGAGRVSLVASLKSRHSP